MNWYKKAQKLNVNQYLSKEEKSSIREINKYIREYQFALKMYQNGILEKQNQAEQENRPLNEKEQIYVNGANFNINDINEKIVRLKGNIEEIKNKVKEEVLKNPNEDRESTGLINSALKTFKTTNNINEAGYILQDGRMLDFSGKRKGGRGNERAWDHREIESIDGIETSRTDAMLEFMNKTGAIRVGYYGGIDIDVMKPISPQQSSVILKNIRGANYITIDITDIKGHTLWAKTINMPLANSGKKLITEANNQF
jgi:hypothetical protein